jgi:hypothetical protein
LKYPDPLSSSVDHRIPMMRFASLPDDEQKRIACNPAGLQPCHLVCNQARGGSQRGNVKKRKPTRGQSRVWFADHETITETPDGRRTSRVW